MSEVEEVKDKKDQKEEDIELEHKQNELIKIEINKIIGKGKKK